MPDFTIVDTAGQRGQQAGSYLSVKHDTTYVGISVGVVHRLDIAQGDRLVLAFDDERRPWIGALHTDVDHAGREHELADVGTHIRQYGDDDHASVETQPFHLHLKRYAPEGGERKRLHLNGDTETAEIAGHTVRLHRLTPEYEPTE